MIFIDTEFTSFDSPRLLSIGLISVDGHHELYRELELFDPAGRRCMREASDFVHDQVLKQWGRMPDCAAVLEQIGQDMGEFLVAAAYRAQGSVVVAYDYEEDLELLIGALRAGQQLDRVHALMLPKNIFIEIAGDLGADLAAEASWERDARNIGIERHHALADARALRAAWLAAEKPAFLDELPPNAPIPTRRCR